MRVLVWSVVGLFLVSSLLMSGTSSSHPNYIPPTTVELDNEAYVAPTLPYCATQIVIRGDVTVEKYCGIERITVKLFAFSSDGFGVEVHPSVIPFINPQKQRFVVIVTIPPGISPGKSSLLVSSSTWVPGIAPYRTEAMCSIIVEGHRQGALEVLEPVYRITDEDTVELDVRVCNRGTVEDTFDLFLYTREAPVEEYEAPTALTVPPRGSVNVTIVLHMETGWLEQGAWTVGVRMDPSHGGREKDNITDYHRRSSSQDALIIEHDWTVNALSRGVQDLTPTLLLVIIILAVLLVASRVWHPRDRMTEVLSEEHGPQHRTIEIGWEDRGDRGGGNT